MTAIVLAMLVIVAIAAAVVVYVAFPHRGERLPVVPLLGDAMRRSVDALPTVPPEDVVDGDVLSGAAPDTDPTQQVPAEVSARPAGKHAARS